jgi:hypothetical protein
MRAARQHAAGVTSGPGTSRAKPTDCHLIQAVRLRDRFAQSGRRWTTGLKSKTRLKAAPPDMTRWGQIVRDDRALYSLAYQLDGSIDADAFGGTKPSPFDSVTCNVVLRMRAL